MAPIPCRRIIPLDPAATGATGLLTQDELDARAAVAAAAVVADRQKHRGVRFCPIAQGTIAPSVIVGGRNLEHGAN